RQRLHVRHVFPHLRTQLRRELHRGRLTRSARPRHVHPRHHVRAERPAIWHEI
ncbi:unnamed protein product, partial [Ascophyllum nodosum]